MKICLFGCGSLGANTAINISRRLGADAEFILVDYDSIEHVNLANQPWFDVNIGQKKATVLCSMLYRTNGVKSEPLIRKVEKTMSFINEYRSLLDSVDLFVDCFDNIPSRKLTQNIARKINRPILHAGFSESIFLADWGTNFPLRDSDKALTPICDRRDLATLVVMGSAITEFIVTRYHKTGIKHRKLLEIHHDIIKLW